MQHFRTDFRNTIFDVSFHYFCQKLRDLEYLSALTDPFNFMQGTSEDEDDDFLKGETPQNDGVVGIAPNSFWVPFLEPGEQHRGPPGCCVPNPQWRGESEVKRWKIVCNFLLCKETLAQLSKLANVI